MLSKLTAAAATLQTPASADALHPSAVMEMPNTLVAAAVKVMVAQELYAPAVAMAVQMPMATAAQAVTPIPQVQVLRTAAVATTAQTTHTSTAAAGV